MLQNRSGRLFQNRGCLLWNHVSIKKKKIYDIEEIKKTRFQTEDSFTIYETGQHNTLKTHNVSVSLSTLQTRQGMLDLSSYLEIQSTSDIISSSLSIFHFKNKYPLDFRSSFLDDCLFFSWVGSCKLLYHTGTWTPSINCQCFAIYNIRI